MNTKESCKLTVEIPKKLHQALKIQCAVDQTTIKNMIIESLYNYVSNKKDAYEKV